MKESNSNIHLIEDHEDETTKPNPITKHKSSNPNKAIFDILDNTFSNIPTILKKYSGITASPRIIKLIQLCYASLSVTFKNPTTIFKDDNDLDECYDINDTMYYFDTIKSSSASSVTSKGSNNTMNSSELVLWKEEVNKKRSTVNKDNVENCDPETRPIIPCLVIYQLWKCMLQLDKPSLDLSTDDKHVIEKIVKQLQAQENEEMLCNLIRDLLLYLGVIDIISSNDNETLSTGTNPIIVPSMASSEPNEIKQEPNEIEQEEDTIQSNDSMNLTAWANTSIGASTNTNNIIHDTSFTSPTNTPLLLKPQDTCIESVQIHINHTINQQYGEYYYYNNIHKQINKNNEWDTIIQYLNHPTKLINYFIKDNQLFKYFYNVIPYVRYNQYICQSLASLSDNEVLKNYSKQKLPFHLISSCNFITFIECITNVEFIQERIDLLGIYYALIQHRLDCLLFSKYLYTIVRWMFLQSNYQSNDNGNIMVRRLSDTTNKRTNVTKHNVNDSKSPPVVLDDATNDIEKAIKLQKQKQYNTIVQCINKYTKEVTIEAYRCYNTLLSKYIDTFMQEYQHIIRDNDTSSISSNEQDNTTFKTEQTAKKDTVLDEKTHVVTITIHYLGMSFGELDLVDDEIKLYESALKIQKDFGNDNDFMMSKTLHCIGASYQHRHDFYKGMKCYMDAIDLWKDNDILEDSEHSLCLADTYHNMGVILCELRDHTKAKSMFEESLRIRREILGDNHNDIADSLQWIGKIYREMNEKDNALRHFKAAHYGKERFYGKDHLEVAECLHNLGIVYGDILDFRSSIQCFKEALRIRYLKCQSTPNDEIIESLLCIANAYIDIQTNATSSTDDNYNENALHYLKEAIKCCETKFYSTLDKMSIEDNNHDNDIYDQYQNLTQCYDRIINLTIEKYGDNQHLEIGKLYLQYGKLHDKVSSLATGTEASSTSAVLALQSYETSLAIFKLHMDEYHLGIILNTLGVYYAKRGKKSMSKAYKYFEEALLVRKLKLGTEHLDYISTLHNVGNMYVKMKQYHKALTCYNDVLHVRKLKLGHDHISVARTLHNMGHVFLQMDEGNRYNNDTAIVANDKYDNAIQSFEEALRIRRLKLGSNHMDVSYTLHALGMVYFKHNIVKDNNTSSTSTAKQYFLESLKIRKSNLGEYHPLIADTLYYIGKIHDGNKEYDDAKEYYSNSLKMYEFCYDNNHVTDINDGIEDCDIELQSNISKVLIDLASVCDRENEAKHQIVEYLDKALSIQKDIQSSSTESNNDELLLTIAQTEQKLGKALFNVHQYNEALQYLKNVLKLYKGHYGKNNSKTAQVMHDIGVLYRIIFVTNNNSHELLDSSKRALSDALNIRRKFIVSIDDNMSRNTILDKTYEEDSEDIAQTLNELGIVYYLESFYVEIDNDDDKETASLLEKGDCKLEALNYFQKSHDMFDRLFGSNSLQVAKVLHNKGNFYRKNNDLKEAKKYYDSALEIFTKKSCVNDMTTAAILTDIGELHYEMKDYQKAHECFEEVLRVNKVCLNDDDHISCADALFNCGLVHHKLDDDNSAMLCFNDVLRIRKLHFEEEDECIAGVLLEIGNILFSREQFHKALKSYEQALRIMRTLDKNKKKAASAAVGSIAYCGTATPRQYAVVTSLDAANIHYSISICNQKLKIFDESLRHAQMALDMTKDTIESDDHMDLCPILEVMGKTYQLKGMYHESLKYFKEILRIKKLSLSSDNVELASTLDQVSALYQVQKECEKALKHMKESLRIRSTQLGNDHPEVGTTLFGMGIIFCDMGKHNDAVKCYETALTIRKRKLGCNSIQVAQILHNLGSVHAMRKEYNRALYRWRGALSIYRGLGFADDDNMVKCTLGNIQMAEELSKQTR